MEIIGAQRGLSEREKVDLVKAKLAYLLRNPDHVYRLNSREASETGRAYTDEAVDVGEIMFALGRCTPRQQRALNLWLGPKALSQERVAKELDVSVITVKRDVGQALRLMVAAIWEPEPGVRQTARKPA